MRLCPLLLLAMALSACAPLRGSGPQFPSEPKAGDVFQGDAPWAYDGQRWIPLRNGYVGVDGCLTKYQGGMVLWKHCGRSADRLSAPTSKFLPPHCRQS
jgi:hypothetical protein